MFSRILRPFTTTATRTYATASKKKVKVAVAGASGGIGQPLSLLLKQCPMIGELALYDIVNTLGVAADVSHVNTPAQVNGYNGPECLPEAFRNADVIIIPAGVPRKPGMTRDDLFNTNASIVRDLVKVAADVAPCALIAIISNPVNSTVPIACEVLDKAGVLDPNRVFGVSTLDVVRACAFVAEAKGLNVEQVNVPVIGGHSGVTIIPLLSQTCPAVKFNDKEMAALTERIQEAGTEVVKAKAGTGSATLSTALAGARFAISLIRGLNGEPNIIECSYVRSNCVDGVKYFATPLIFGRNGIEQNLGVGKLNNFEQTLLGKALPDLKKNIQKGEDFIRKNT